MNITFKSSDLTYSNPHYNIWFFSQQLLYSMRQCSLECYICNLSTRKDWDRRIVNSRLYQKTKPKKKQLAGTWCSEIQSSGSEYLFQTKECKVSMCLVWTNLPTVFTGTVRSIQAYQRGKKNPFLFFLLGIKCQKRCNSSIDSHIRKDRKFRDKNIFECNPTVTSHRSTCSFYG